MRTFGKTFAMVKSLSAPCIVLVHTLSMRSYVRRMIADVHGPGFEREVKVEIVNSSRDLDKLRGLQVPVYIDHAVLDYWHSTAHDLAHLLKLVEQINERAVLRRRSGPTPFGRAIDDCGPGPTSRERPGRS